MNAKRRRIAPMLLLAAVLAREAASATAPSTQAVADAYSRLVRQLGDLDPAVRKAARSALATAPDAARPALRQAIRSGRPAVVAAATDLLLHSSWIAIDDPLSVQNFLASYGSLAPDRRAVVLDSLVHAKVDVLASHRAALRVSQQEPVDGVVWTAFDRVPLDDSWQPLLTAKDIGPLPTPVLIARARGILIKEDDAGSKAPPPLSSKSTRLLEQALDQEREHPTGNALQLKWAVNVLVNRYLAADQPVKAAEKLRMLIGRGEINPAEDNAAELGQASTNFSDSNGIAPQLMELQARFGPLPGLDRDLSLAADESNDQQALVLGAIAQRIGSVTAARMLLAGAMADIAGESDRDHAARLFEVGSTLIRLGLPDAAQSVLERAVAIDVPGLDKITEAYLRLSDIRTAAGDEQAAGDCLQRALDHLGPGEQLTAQRASGKKEIWPREEVQGRIAWLYLVAARKRNDVAEIKKQAVAVMESGTLDSETFLDTLPTLESKDLNVAEPDAVQAYFDRVYAKAAAELAGDPENPMQKNDVAWLCSRSGRKLDQALSLATEAVALRPDEAAYVDTLAEAKFRTGSPAQALTLEIKAVQMLHDSQVQNEKVETFMKGQVERFRQAAAAQPLTTMPPSTKTPSTKP